MPTDRSQAVRVQGLAEFQRELKKAGADLPKQLAGANRDAAQVVATQAVSNLTSLGGVAARIAPTVKAAAEQRRSKVTLGGPQHPEAMGAEFGGQGRPTTQQFRPHRGREGYGLYPAVRETEDEFMRTYEQMLGVLMRKAFPNN